MSQSPSTHTCTHTRETFPQHSSCARTSVELPAPSPGATAGRGTSGRHVVCNRTTPSCRALPTTSPPPPLSSSPPSPPHSLPPSLRHLQQSLPLWRTALRASPITQCSGRAAGLTAHMSQHDQGVSCHACPLTFPTLGVQAGSESREKNTRLPPWLPKCYHMVRSLPLSPMVCPCLSASLSSPRHWGCL